MKIPPHAVSFSFMYSIHHSRGFALVFSIVIYFLFSYTIGFPRGVVKYINLPLARLYP